MIEESDVPNKWAVFFLVAVGSFMSTLDGSIVNITLPVIMKDLNSSLPRIEWVVMIYLLTIVSLLLSFGRLSDLKGRRWVYVRGLIIFTLGSLLCSTAHKDIWLILSRLFQGVGAAMVMSCTPAIIVDTFDIQERGKAFGMMGAIVASGLTIGPALGGFLIHNFSWRAVFYINIPIGILAAAAVNRYLRGGSADTTRSESFDWIGAILFAVCLGALLLVVTHGYSWGVTLFPTGVVAGISIVSLMVLIWVETHTQHPIIEPSLLKIRLFVFPLVSAVLLFATLFILVFLMPFYLMNPAGYSPNQAGYLMVCLFVTLFVVSPLSGTLSDRIGSRALSTLGMGILMVGFYMLSFLTADATAVSIGWRLSFAGLGIAVFISPNNAAIMSAVPGPFRGIAGSTVAVARSLGMVIGIALAGVIFNLTFFRQSGGRIFTVYKPELETIFMSGFHNALYAGSCVAGIGIVTSFLRGRENRT